MTHNELAARIERAEGPDRALLDRAKALIAEKLAAHPDAAVRALAEVTELDDNHPGVQKIAAALRARSAS